MDKIKALAPVLFYGIALGVISYIVVRNPDRVTLLFALLAKSPTDIKWLPDAPAPAAS